MVTTARHAAYGNARFVQVARELLLDAARFRRSAMLSSSIALSDPRRESAAESLSAGHLYLAGLPTPEFQYAIRTSRGTYYPDFYWPDQHVIGECDGALKYTEPAQLVAEKVREDALRELGNRFVRWLGREVMANPTAVVGRVSRSLGM